MKELIVDEQTALVDFERFIDAMDIDGNTSAMNEEDRNGFEGQRKVVVTAITKGALVINDVGEPVFSPASVDVPSGTITFYEPTGAAYMAMDRKKKGEDVGKMFSMMADMTKQHPSIFAKMKQRDLKVCQALAVLFLA